MGGNVMPQSHAGQRVRWLGLLQPCVLGLGFFQDGDVGVGVFPEGEEVFVSGESTDLGGIGICTLGRSCLQSIRPRQAQTRQRSCPAVPDDAAVVDDFLELGSGFLTLSCRKICLTADVCVIEAGDIGHDP